MKFDLHSHTTCSDGSFSPEELVLRAEVKNVDVLAITDHDSIAALDAAQAAIDLKKYKVKLVAGVEISTKWHGFDIHIVGLCVDHQSEALNLLLVQQRDKRNQRALKIGEKLAKRGLAGVYEKAKLLAAGESISRSHFAKAMIELGYVPTFDHAFKKYLGKGKSAFVAPDWCDIEEAVDTIKTAGGISVIAHPVRYDMSNKWLRKLISQFKAAGGNGLEVGLSQVNPDQKKFVADLAVENDLYSSLGSDFHHESRWTELGRHLSLTDKCTAVWEHPNWRLLQAE